MIVEVSDAAREYVLAGGGRLFLRPRTTKCCAGAMTFLDASTSISGDEAAYLEVASDDLDIRFLDRGLSPNRATVEMRGRRHPHLVAFWDGCAYRL